MKLRTSDLSCGSSADGLIRLAGSHPYLCTLAVCLLLNAFSFGAIWNVTSNGLFAGFCAVYAAAAYGVYCKYKSGVYRKKQAELLAAIYLAIDLAAAALYSRSENKGLWLIAGGCAAVMLFYSFAKTDRFRMQLDSLLIMGTGFFIKYGYVLYTSIYSRQHDVGYFGGEDSHAGYIDYLLNNHRLPDFDVREVWQFCHPPLHHGICALWIYISENIFGVDYDRSRESLQTLTLFYSMCIIITSYKILRHFGLSGKALYAPLLIIAFHPAFIMFSGSINNDVLAAAFTMGAIYCALKWYDSPTVKNILKIALCIGLGMMTKLSAAVAAIPVALIFLIVFIREFRRSGGKLLGQFCIFGAVCVPLALWFEIKNYILYRVPVTYVQEMDKSELQYIGDQSFLSRITDFSPKQFKSVFEQWIWNGDPPQSYNEYNPIIAAMKNSLFGEYINESSFGQDKITVFICTVFFWLSVLLAALCLILGVMSLFRRCRMSGIHKLFFASFYITMMINFYKMSADYPFTCTMNFRYITPTVTVSALFMGIFMQSFEKSKGGVTANKAITALSLAFAVLSSYIFMTVCICVQ